MRSYWCSVRTVTPASAAVWPTLIPPSTGSSSPTTTSVRPDAASGSSAFSRTADVPSPGQDRGVADDVSPEDPFERSRALVNGSEMAYVDVGEGDAIVFLHGNPTSSYLWRNVIPHVQHLGRCLAPDLIGMGESAKLPDPQPGTYSFATHAGFLDRFLEEVEATERVTLVLHDWGSALGFDWAARHPAAVRGIAFTEAIVNPLIWADWPREGKRVF